MIEQQLQQQIKGLSDAKRAWLEQMLRQKGIALPKSASFSLGPRRRDETDLPLSFGQQRLWFLDRLEPGGAGYNIPIAVRLRGQLDCEALERSLSAIVERHEVLRTTFADRDGQPSLVIHPAQSQSLPRTDLGGGSTATALGREAEARKLAMEEARRPFDLATGPLLRARLLRLDEADHVLIVVMHHIVSDGWSMGVLIRETVELYRAFVRGLEPNLSPLPIQYADYAAWQREWLVGAELEKQLGYWTERLRGKPTLLELPTDRSRPAAPTSRGAEYEFSLPANLRPGLVALSRQEDATLFMALLAVFQTLLYRYTGQTDINVGTPIANRTRAEVEPLIGFFANTLVMNADLSGDPSFRQLLKRVRESALGAYAHQDLPFERLVEALGVERDLTHSPLFQTMLVVQNPAADVVELSGLSLSPFKIERGATQFDLTVLVTESAEGFGGAIEYNPDLFDASTIARMAGHLRTLLEGIVADPDARISRLPLLTKDEHQFLVEWNKTVAPFPDDKCLHELFEAQARRASDKTAVTFEGQSLSYRELDRRANQLAHYLQRLGVGPEVLVGISVERSLEMIVGVLGVLKAGGAYLPIDPTYPEERRRFMLEDAEAPVLLTQSHLAATMPAHNARVVCLDTDWSVIAEESAGRLTSGASPGNLAYVIYTSGSTGKPKGTLIEHRGVCNFVTAYARDLRIDADSRCLQFASLSFDASVSEIFTALTTGATLCLARREQLLSETELLRILREQAITVACLPPSMLRLLPAADLPALRTVISAGEACTREIVERWAPGRVLVNGYGPTEITIGSNWRLITDPAEVGGNIPIGRPIANTQAYILDAQQQPVPVGVPGELHLGGAGLARGYLNRPELTAERFVELRIADCGLQIDAHPTGNGSLNGQSAIRNPQSAIRVYKTGDIARYLPDGDIEFLGRIDHQVKLRGQRVELGEIETVLRTHPGLDEAVVIAREDTPGDQRLVAYCVPSGAPPDDSSDFRADLLAQVRQRLPEFMTPSAFVLMGAIPLLPNGKVNRHALPVPDEASVVWQESFVAPRTPVEEVLAGIWASVLGLPRVGVADNFFELGGHSLLATQLISRVRDAFGVELPLRSLFEAPAVAEFAPRLDAALKATRGVEAPPIVPVPREGELPLSFGQQRLWFFDQFEPGSAVYNLPSGVRLTGRLDFDALERSVNEIVRRHEVLRTSFATRDGQPVPVIAPEHGGATLRIAVPVEDISHLSGEAQEQEQRRLFREEAAAPFDLSTGPLLRVKILKLAGHGGVTDDHVVLLTMHHIVSDGWSMGVFIRELATLYQAFALGQPSPLAELPVQYADYAYWQRRWLEGAELERQLSYWRDQLGDGGEVLELPTDCPRPAVQTNRGATESFALSPELSGQIRALSRREGVTLFMTLLSAFQTLLHRYTGQEQISVGTPIANRQRSEIESLIGFFINTLVMRTDTGGDPSFRELLKRVRESALGAYAHQDVPFERLVDALGVARDMSHSPLFQVMFILQNTPGGEMELPDLKLSPIEPETGVATFDLTLAMSEENGVLTGAIEYNTDLFDRETIARWIGHFRTLLEAVVADPNQTLSRLLILTQTEQRQLLAEWNDTSREFPLDRSVHTLFEAQAAREPESVAVNDGLSQLTYGELNRRTNRLAHHLRRLGVGPESLVAVCLNRSVALVAALVGVLKAGGAYLPLDPLHPAERLSAILKDAQPRVVLTEQALLPKFASGSTGIPVRVCDAACVAEESGENPPNLTAPGNLAYVIYTSGSTGKPKGVLIEQRSLANAFFAWNQAYGLDAIKSHLQMANVTFDVFTGDLVRALCSGGKLVLCPRELLLAPPELYELLQHERIACAEFVPAVLRQLAAYLEETGQRLEFLRLLICGSDAWTAGEYRRFRKLCGPETRLINSFGITEATIDSTWYERLDETLAAEQPVPIGRPFANTQVYVLDRNRQLQPVGVTGELYLGGAGLARGYLHNAELTAERFVEVEMAGGRRMYKTGDLVRWRADGTVQFLGRADHQVKIRGYRIEPGEVEAALCQQAGVTQAVVTAHEDEAGRKRLVAYLVAAGGAQFDATALRAHLREKLPEYMTPAAFVRLEALPLSANGKVERRRLPAPVFEAREEGGSAPPQTEVEAQLVELWQQVLGLKTVGIHDNFFALGGDSILSIQIIARARQAGLQLTPRQLFEHPTVAGQASVASFGRAIEAEQGIVTGEAPLTPIQRWFFAQELPEPWHWNQTALLAVAGGMQRELLAATVARLLEHHDALRMRFEQRGEGWRQENAAMPEQAPTFWFDLSNESDEAAARAVERISAELQAGFDLGAGLLIRVAYFDLGPQRAGRLLLAVHHLAVDGVSWRILMEDLQTIYAQLGEEQATAGSHPQHFHLPAKTTSFRQWSGKLEAYAQTGRMREELSYWLDVARGALTALPVDFPDGANTEATLSSVTASLDPQETRALLQAVPAAYGTEINDALLTALGEACARWTGARAVLVQLEGHGREEILPDADISRTVGWFTTEYPVRLEFAPGTAPGEALKQTKERLRRIPKNGIGYGLLRYLSSDPAVRRQLESQPHARIGFNYLGQMDQTFDGETPFQPAREEPGPMRSPRGSLSNLIDINGGISEGQLRLEWSFSSELYRRETVERVANDFVAALRRLIAHCQSPDAGGYTPSDFALASLDQRKLDKVLGKLRQKKNNNERNY